MTTVPADVREIYDKYLKYHQGEAFLFGKGTFSENKWLWVPVEKDKYTSGEIINESGGKLTVRCSDGTDVTIEKDKASFMNPPKFDGSEDCAELGYLSEASVLHNLRKRYDKDIIYVSSIL
jgi:myosin protein heavy chain